MQIAYRLDKSDTTAKQVQITDCSLITDSISSTNISCNGVNNGSSTIIVTGGTEPYTYLWSNGQTSSTIDSLSAGEYSVIGTDFHTCTVTDSIIITEPPPIVINVISIDTVQNGNDGAIDITVSGGTPPYNYSWSNGAVTEDLDSIPAGFYTLIVTDSLGCIDSLTIQVPGVTGMFETNLQKQYLIFPNPLNERINIQYSNPGNISDAVIVIYNTTSEKVKEFKINEFKGIIIINAEDLKQGLYLVNLFDNNGLLDSKKLLIIR